jgi:hypothetical protein
MSPEPKRESCTLRSDYHATYFVSRLFASLGLFRTLELFLELGTLLSPRLHDERSRPAHEFARVMQAANPVAEPDRDAFLKEMASELGQHEVVGPGLLHRIISEVQRRYDVVDQRRTTPTI